MKKARGFYAIIWTICLISYNFIVFVVPNDNTESATFWIGYFLIGFALLGNLICSLIVLGAKSNAKVFYNIPLISISVAGVVIASIAGAIFMHVPGIASWIGVLVSYLTVVVVTIAALIAKSAADVVDSIDEKIKVKTSFIKDLTLDAEFLMKSTKSPEIKEYVKNVYEALRYSDPMSSEKLANEEQRIQQQFELLSDTVLSNDADRARVVSEYLLNLIEYRNKKCRLTK